MSKAPAISLREYAKSRKARGLPGGSAESVSKAIEAGRLRESVTRDERGHPKIADPELADREWVAGTDHSKAPSAVKERASAGAAAPPEPSAAPPPRPVPRPRPVCELPPPADGEQPVTQEPENLSLSLESAREKHWKANKAEIEYRERIGQLVDAEEMKLAVADAFTRVRSRLAGLPTRARQRIPHLTAEDVATLESFVREALDELALKLEDEEDEDEDGDGGA